MTAPLLLESICVERGGRRLLHEVDLRVEPGMIIAVTGPSGSGKTTLLRTIVGLEAPSSGHVVMSGRAVSRPNRIAVPPEQRHIAMVFQDLGLWPHMSVSEHLQFVLAAQSVPKRDRPAPIDQMLKSVGLHGRERQLPGTLSGGERQRLAIARALVIEPAVLLLDEPLSNLDIVLKNELLELLCALLRSRHTAVIYVTHDPSEALRLTSHFAVLEQGRLSPPTCYTELLKAPGTPFTRKLALLLGQMKPMHPVR
jgi:iron(III) transport system ATP-binding protein